MQDRNLDAAVSYSLEFGPEGMYIENDVVIWKTDSAHVEVYDVRLVASDGFERTVQEFKLFSRAGVKILSKPPVSASVGTKYSYPVKVWKQKPDQIINYKLFYGPDGMALQPDGSGLAPQRGGP